jgi:hypothetical protein
VPDRVLLQAHKALTRRRRVGNNSQEGAMAEEDDSRRCAVCDQPEDSLDNMTRKRFKINKLCGHYL